MGDVIQRFNGSFHYRSIGGIHAKNSSGTFNVPDRFFNSGVLVFIVCKIVNPVPKHNIKLSITQSGFYITLVELNIYQPTFMLNTSIPLEGSPMLKIDWDNGDLVNDVDFEGFVSFLEET